MIWRCDLEKQAGVHIERLLHVAREVIGSGRYVLGERVKAFEDAFAAYCGVSRCVSVANGTEAITLGLKAVGVQAGDEVVTTPFTAIPTISAIVLAGARPVFADIDPRTFLIDVGQVAGRIGARTKAVVPVHLFSQMVDVQALRARIPVEVRVIEDAAQAHGCLLRGRMAGTLGDVGAYSFYPSKNLGCYGDGGAIVTDDAELADRVRLLRNYGKRDEDLIVCDGANSRLDELQAAFLLVKLGDLEAGNARRRALADAYAQRLRDLPMELPYIAPDALPNYHVYVVKVRERRDDLRSYLARRGIQTDVFYRKPHHLQPAFAHLGYGRGDFPNAEAIGKEVLALPMYPEMAMDDLDLVCAEIRKFHEAGT